MALPNLHQLLIYKLINYYFVGYLTLLINNSVNKCTVNHKTVLNNVYNKLQPVTDIFSIKLTTTKNNTVKDKNENFLEV